MSDVLKTPAGSPAPGLDDRQKAALRFDLVSQIASPEIIGNRYNLGGEAGLNQYLRANPSFADDVSRMRSLFSSDMSAQERARLKATLASEELVGDVYHIVTNPNYSPAQRIDAFKQLNRMGGIDGLPAAAKDGAGNTGTSFNLVINMPDGRRETIFATVNGEDTPQLEAPPRPETHDIPHDDLHDIARMQNRADRADRADRAEGPQDAGEQIEEILGMSKGFWAS